MRSDRFGDRERVEHRAAELVAEPACVHERRDIGCRVGELGVEVSHAKPAALEPDGYRLAEVEQAPQAATDTGRGVPNGMRERPQVRSGPAE